MKIRGQLALVIAAPLIMACLLSGVALIGSWGQAKRAGHAEELTRLAGRSGALVELVRREQVAAAGVLTGAADAVQAYEQARSDMDVGVRDFARDRSRLGSERRLQAVDTGLAGLERLREQVVARRVTLSAAAARYRILSADLVAFRDAVALAGGITSETADHIRATAALSRAREAAAQQHVLMLRVDASGVMTGRASQELAQAQAEYEQALEAFTDAAQPGWRSALAVALADAQAVEARRLEDEAARIMVGARASVDPAVWATVMDARARVLRAVETRADADVVAEVDATRSRLWGNTVVLGVVLVATIAVTGVMGAVLGRRLARRVRTLRDGTQEFTRRLPALLDEARAAQDAAPREVALRAVPATSVGGRDEITDLAREFATTQRAVVAEAVRAAQAHQAHEGTLMEVADRLRRRTAQTAQLLVAVQHRETDPDKLGQLYRIDHTVALNTRLADNLLRIGGGQSGRVRPTMSLLDVVRAALGRITAFDRLGDIDVSGVPDHLAVRGTAVDALVQALGELIDNAAVFSAATVTVQASTTAGDVEVLVEDTGIGLPDARMNAWISRPDTSDPHAVQHMGLTVVGLVAHRLGLRVRLEPREDGVAGTRARVLIPAHLTTDAAPTQPPTAPASAAGTWSAAPSRAPQPSTSVAVPRRGRHAAPAPVTRGGLPRRVPGTAVPSPLLAQAQQPAAAKRPDLERRVNAAGAFAAGRARSRRRFRPTDPELS